MSKIKINDKFIGDDFPCYTIAEAGANHDGELEKALRLIDAAYDANSDSIKLRSLINVSNKPSIPEKTFTLFEKFNNKNFLMPVIPSLPEKRLKYIRLSLSPLMNGPIFIFFQVVCILLRLYFLAYIIALAQGNNIFPSPAPPKRIPKLSKLPSDTNVYFIISIPLLGF